ncbi:AHH domain-containing protein [Archangium sp. miwbw1]|uniref:AHH domain-containing protein n=1 Tax=Archangium lansingense TaxID=2995310 RepID=A0ABT4AP85_9BACT|nr:AHH domain-containing protein [Archangium lansinium]MCY1083522.1 AHH domain-containing protein [Archangium lansinium]
MRTSPLPGGGLRLSFEPVAPDPALERLRVEQARAVLADVHASPLLKDGARLQLVLASTAPGGALPGGWQSRLREELLSRFGPSPLPLPESLETSPVFQALKLSPRYMGAGVREAARELFTSPVFLTSVGLSVILYFSAWLVPEPVFTKAFAAMLTLRLALVVGVLELTRVAQACVRLYQEAEAARTPEELEAVAERFGKALGGTGLRVLMLVASLGVARGLPQVPEGGLATLLRAPRFALPEGVTLEGASAVKMVADGTVVVAGVAAGTAAASAGSACSDGSEKMDGYRWHHLATNKNDISNLRGGPWTPRFEDFFEMAGMSLDAKENLIYLKGHKGPHPEEYHDEVYDRLQRAMRNCGSIAQCRSKLVSALKQLADEICTPGSHINRLITKSQD